MNTISSTTQNSSDRLQHKNCWMCYGNSSRNLCSKCGVAIYCNRTCQVLDWKNHKKYCKNVSIIKEATLNTASNQSKDATNISSSFTTTATTTTDDCKDKVKIMNGEENLFIHDIDYAVNDPSISAIPFPTLLETFFDIIADANQRICVQSQTSPSNQRTINEANHNLTNIDNNPSVDQNIHHIDQSLLQQFKLFETLSDLCQPDWGVFLNPKTTDDQRWSLFQGYLRGSANNANMDLSHQFRNIKNINDIAYLNISHTVTDIATTAPNTVDVSTTATTEPLSPIIVSIKTIRSSESLHRRLGHEWIAMKAAQYRGSISKAKLLIQQCRNHDQIQQVDDLAVNESKENEHAQSSKENLTFYLINEDLTIKGCQYDDDILYIDTQLTVQKQKQLQPVQESEVVQWIKCLDAFHIKSCERNEVSNIEKLFYQICIKNSN